MNLDDSLATLSHTPLSLVIMLKFALVLLTVGIGVLVAVEWVLRWRFGFGNPLLYVADERIGYLLAPNQRVRRMGNLIAVNTYSMRGDAVAPQRSPNTLRVLLLGDSIANGGWWTDQSATISALMQQQIQQQITSAIAPPSTNPAWRTVEVLNASANSWGPRNELAYVERFGSFNAQLLVLLINTDDLFAIAPSSLVVGRDRNYPTHNPPLAIVEAWGRLRPVPLPPELQALQSEPGDRVGLNLAAIATLASLSQQADCRLLVAHTPLLRELQSQGGSKDYEVKARQRLLELTRDRQIPYIDFLPAFNTVTPSTNLYRDHIHLSPTGNQQVSQTLVTAILQVVSGQSLSL